MRFLKVVSSYLAAAALGVGLFFCARPYAMAHRVNPSLYGGEILLIFVPLIILLLRRAAKY